MRDLLLVTIETVWPATSGVSQRLSLVTGILAERAQRSTVISARAPENSHQPGVEVQRHPPAATRLPRPRAWMRWVRSGLPMSAVSRDYSGVRAEVDSLTDRTWSGLIWVHRLETWANVKDLLPRGPLVIDADDFEVNRIEELLGTPSVRHGARRWARDRFLKDDARRHQSLMLRALDAGAVITLANPDHQRIWADRGVLLLPNSAQPPSHPLTDTRWRRTPRVVTFVGKLSYEPNRRAVIRICDSLAKRFSEVYGPTEVRIVGAGQGELRDSAVNAPVTFRGFVGDLDSELDASDVVIIPIESGSGTRIKAIDALSRALPIISTRKGVEGLGLEDGLTYLRAETDADFAGAWAPTPVGLADYRPAPGCRGPLPLPGETLTGGHEYESLRGGERG